MHMKRDQKDLPMHKNQREPLKESSLIQYDQLPSTACSGRGGVGICVDSILIGLIACMQSCDLAARDSCERMRDSGQDKLAESLIKSANLPRLHSRFTAIGIHNPLSMMA